jgi:hypothetical protein
MPQLSRHLSEPLVCVHACKYIHTHTHSSTLCVPRAMHNPELPLSIPHLSCPDCPPNPSSRGLTMHFQSGVFHFVMRPQPPRSHLGTSVCPNLKGLGPWESQAGPNTSGLCWRIPHGLGLQCSFLTHHSPQKVKQLLCVWVKNCPFYS